MTPQPLPRSLSDVHESVAPNYLSKWKRGMAFAGPAYLVSVEIGRASCRERVSSPV